MPSAGSWRASSGWSRRRSSLSRAGPRRASMVAGLRLGDHVLEPARRYAAAAGVRVVPSYTVDEAGLAIIVEADG